MEEKQAAMRMSTAAKAVRGDSQHSFCRRQPVPELWHMKRFQQGSENVCAPARSSTENLLGLLATMVSTH